MPVHVLSPLITNRNSTPKNEYTALIELYERKYHRSYADSNADCAEEGRRGVEGVEGICLLLFENGSLAGAQSPNHAGEERKVKGNEGKRFGGGRRTLNVSGVRLSTKDATSKPSSTPQHPATMVMI